MLPNLRKGFPYAVWLLLLPQLLEFRFHFSTPVLISAQFQEPFQVSDGFFLLAKTFVGEPPLAVTVSIIGAKLDGFSVVGDGPWVIAQFIVGEPSIIVGIGVVIVDLDGPVKIGEGLLVIAFVLVGSSPSGVCVDVIGSRSRAWL